ncbi:ribbon-helix-helix domain-containing protein [Massilia sp. LXY-6]
MLAQLRALSEQCDVPVSELIRRAIDEFLNKQK